MSLTARDTVALARAALAAGKESFPSYSHPRSPRKFSQPQLFAMLVLRRALQVDYRLMVQVIAERRKLRKALQLGSVPTYSTLCHAERRLLPPGPLTDALLQRFVPPDDGG